MIEQEKEDAFDEGVDAATQRVIEEFDFLGLPEGESLSDLMVRVNDTLTQLFAEFK